MLYYSKSTGGFYDSDIHGERSFTMVDPAWVRPMKKVPDPSWVQPEDDPASAAPLIDVPDMSIDAPLVTVANAGCLIPEDAVAVSAETHASLMQAQAAGKAISADSKGNPVAVDPVAVMSLPQAKQAQIAILEAAYEAAVTAPVSYTTAGGVTKNFQADLDSQIVLVKSQQGFALTGSVPEGFYWVASDNTQVPFTLADLKGLYAAILAQGWAAFQRLQTQKAAVRAATSKSAVQAVTW
ncbi:hypothetical protein R77592_04437 [Ralstonia mannitolilytica]|uniref:DUF4376 domain-containing protein n=1 Tax=Ralstonia mannitolilytica TaxID=105219 RepID=UPI000E03C050|nr:DUF4376 domain-containing protein [Ralstonia mannitolilytica]CAJ0737800.1 hypothetical protein R77592_04437 [Ralstonia mannitolilytica]SUD94215.1 Uncharacterised protein [Ralstonia mannitolilytica]